MTKTGKLNSREMATLNKAWEILSRWTAAKEEEADRNGYEADADYLYNNAMYAVVGLCEFIEHYEED